MKKIRVKASRLAKVRYNTQTGAELNRQWFTKGQVVELDDEIADRYISLDAAEEVEDDAETSPEEQGEESASKGGVVETSPADETSDSGVPPADETSSSNGDTTTGTEATVRRPGQPKTRASRSTST